MPVSKKRKYKKKKNNKRSVGSKIPMMLQKYSTPATSGSLDSLNNMISNDRVLHELEFNGEKDIELIDEEHHVKGGIPSVTYKYKYDGELYEIDFIDKYLKSTGKEPNTYSIWIVKDNKDVMSFEIVPEHHSKVKEDKCKSILNLYLDSYR